MWPTGFTDNSGDTYLFYTSERNPSDPLSEIAGNIWYLKVDWSTSNDHYTYIQNAIDAASAGDTVNVMAGTYVEDLVIPAGMDGLDLKGSGSNVTTIKGVATADDSLGDPPVYNIRFDEFDGVSGVKIHGFTIESPDVPTNHFASGMVLNGQDIEIYDNCFVSKGAEAAEDNYCVAIQTWRWSAAPDSDITGLKIYNNTFSSEGDLWVYQGVFVNRDGEDFGDVTVSGNNFSGNIHMGIAYEGNNAVISDNEMTSTYEGVGIAIMDWAELEQNDVEVDGNELQGFNDGVIVGRGDQVMTNITVANNAFSDNRYQVRDRADALNLDDVLAHNDFDRAVVVRGSGIKVPTIFSSIQDAIDAAVAGDTVEVAVATYDESVTIDKNNLTLTGEVGSKPAITGGLKLDDVSGFTLQNFEVTGTVDTGNKNSLVRMYGVITDLIVDNCVFDGENTADRNGFSGGQIEGDLSVTNSEFKDIVGWAVLDTRSGSGGDGSAMDTVTFANNNVHDCDGSIAFRGLSTNWTDNVYIYDNTFQDIGEEAVSDHWAAFEVNRVTNVEVYDNEIRNVVECSWGEGQAMQLWQVGTVSIHDNTIENNYMGIAFLKWPADETYDVSNISIHYNKFSGNDQYALSVEDGLTGGLVDATYNWWGSSSGPYHKTLNPGGTGDAVSDYVDFEPWLREVPTVTTQAATEVRFILATVNMDYTVGGYSPVQVRFAYKKSTDTEWSYTAWVSKSVDGAHAQLLRVIDFGARYDFKAQLKYDDVVDGETVIEGSILQFTTSPIEGCFIATAAYGTPSAEQIDVLREFRDMVLLESTVGSQLVALYYQLSPPVAEFIAGNELLRTMVRELLVDPIVGVVEATGNVWRN